MTEIQITHNQWEQTIISMQVEIMTWRKVHGYKNLSQRLQDEIDSKEELLKKERKRFDDWKKENKIV